MVLPWHRRPRHQPAGADRAAGELHRPADRAAAVRRTSRSLKMLDERRERIRGRPQRGRARRRQAAEASGEAQEQIEAARREGQAIVAQAQQVAQRVSGGRARRRRSSSRKRCWSARAARSSSSATAAIAELRKEFADLTISAAEKVIGQSLDRQRAPAADRAGAGGVVLPGELGEANELSSAAGADVAAIALRGEALRACAAFEIAQRATAIRPAWPSGAATRSPSS